MAGKSARRTGKSIQYAFRLPYDLAARLEAYRSAKGHEVISETVRELLETGLKAGEQGGMQDVMQDVMQPGYTALAGRLALLEDTVRALQERMPPAPAVKAAAGAFDPDRHYMGPLCERGHDWQGTGQSRYARRNRMCMACEAESAKARRARRKAGDAV